MILRRCFRCRALVQGRCPCRQASSIERGYGSAWQRLRASILADDPDCAACGAPARVVDHIIARVNGGSDARDNLQALCRACHARKTAADVRAHKDRARGVRAL